MQTTLTRIFIVLESVSLGLSENLDEISRNARKLEGFFRSKKKKKKKKKKKVFAEIESEFSAGIRNSKVSSAQNQVVSKKKKKKKKRSSPKSSLIFRPKSGIQTFEGGLFSYGGSYFQFFTKNRPQKHQKRAILHTSQANGGGSSPPPGYATESHANLPYADALCNFLAQSATLSEKKFPRLRR